MTTKSTTATWRDGIIVHPLADSFPMLPDGELEELAADMKKNGQREPVAFVKIDGKKVLVDGRNRMAACFLVGIKPKVQVHKGTFTDEQIVALIISRNVHRRHLTPAQRQARLEAAIIADPTASARAIGEKVGVDKNKAVKTRKKLESTGAVRPVQKTVGKDGKARTATPKKPAAKKKLAATTEQQKTVDGMAADLNATLFGGANGFAATGSTTATVEESVEQRKAAYEVAEQDDEAQDSASELWDFQIYCNMRLPRMSPPDRAAALKHCQEECDKLGAAS